MTSKEFQSVLIYPGLLNSESLPALEELVNHYPWYATAQLVLAKNLLQMKHVRYPGKLKLASVATIDRSLLKQYLLENQNLPPKELSSEILVSIPTAVVPEPSVSIGKIASNISPIEELPEPLRISSREVEETEVNASAILENQSPTPVVEAIENSASSFESSSAKTSDEEPFPFEPYTQLDFTTELLKLPVLDSSPEPIKSNATPEPKSSGKRSFSDWLKSSKEIHSSQPNSDDEWQRNGIIERFLEDQPRISKPKQTEFFKPQEAAKKSLSLPEGLVTETLAKIYENQGHFERAIHAYEKLSVKHPEKITYFAARISKLKERLKD